MLYIYRWFSRDGPQNGPPQSPDRTCFELFFRENMTLLFIEKNLRIFKSLKTVWDPIMCAITESTIFVY